MTGNGNHGERGPAEAVVGVGKSHSGEPATGAGGISFSRPVSAACSRRPPHETVSIAVHTIFRDALLTVRHIAETQSPEKATVQIHAVANAALTLHANK